VETTSAVHAPRLLPHRRLLLVAGSEDIVAFDRAGGSAGKFIAVYEPYAEGGQTIPRLIHCRTARRGGQSDGAAGILHDRHVVTEAGGILGRPCDAKIRGQPAQDQLMEAALTQPAVEPSGGDMVVFEERRVAVELDPAPLANDELNPGLVDAGMDRRLLRAGDAVVGPQDLRAVGGWVCASPAWRKRARRRS
jgi:hypothetical protein